MITREIIKPTNLLSGRYSRVLFHKASKANTVQFLYNTMFGVYILPVLQRDNWSSMAQLVEC